MTTRFHWVAILVLTGCTDQASVEGRSCPCAAGYLCCSTNVCVADGEACPIPQTQDPHDPRVNQDDPLLAHPCMADENDGTIDTRWVYEYDSLGNEVHATGDHGNDGTINEVIDRTFTDASQLVTEQRSTDGARDYLASWTYDDLGRTATETIESPDGTDATTWTYAGTTATSEQRHHDMLVAREVFEQTAGQPVMATATNADGSPSFTETWSYSDAGDVMTHDARFPSGVVYHYTYSRDAAGHLLSLDVVDQKSSFLFGWKNTFDDAGRLATETLTTLDLAPDRTTFQYCP